MKKYLVAIALTVATTVAYAACLTNTIVTPDGKVIMCTTCCYGGNCTTTCV